ncbi:rhamnose/proton symporter RhaT [Reichenbachiella carrageenanivorans]|uniref:Rhamnose/proton symporter RhaT n=1 Tax=Reichenbachiella carrageenanivorans TaxID=2979869 RepID=A0ABY6D1Z0_9BACT|nr:L-rhamnose/proton symporter RhaT [Reichenbachiella carrageenanivorans]UXX77855.1 rhamnose/proton symporter RhaT [Reichenbachiella carrageenanivorans]
MIEGIIWAILAGLMLGLYALPEKFTKDFEFENTWSLFFAINTFLVPNVAAFLLIDGFGEVLAAIPSGVLIGMVVSSLLWGIGVMMWGKAINHIGLSLGFSLFIGTIILVGSLIPFVINGLPKIPVFATIMAGIFVVLIGVVANGRAGILRQASENEADQKSGSMATGILIAVIGGLLATGFSYANTVGGAVIHEAVIAQGNPEWMSAVAVMYVIYMAGGLAIAVYFVQQLTAKKLWSKFNTPSFGKNALLASIMGVFNFAASAGFAYAAFKLGSTGGTVGYAIFNTVAVAVAIVSGLITKEWVNASAKSKNALYMGLGCMILGIVIVAIGNGL